MKQIILTLCTCFIFSITLFAAKPQIEISQVAVKTGIEINNKPAVLFQIVYSVKNYGSGYVNFNIWIKDKNNNFRRLSNAQRSKDGLDCFRTTTFVSRNHQKATLDLKIPTENLLLNPTEKEFIAIVTIDDFKNADMSKRQPASTYPFTVNLDKKYSYLDELNRITIPDAKPQPKIEPKPTPPAMAANNTSAKPSAKINKAWIEHDVTHNNKKAMKIHCNYNVYDHLGKSGALKYDIKDENGKILNIGAESCSKDNMVVNPYTSPYRNTIFEDKWTIIYIKDIPIKPGQHKYYVTVSVKDFNGNTLCISDPIPFIGTGPTNSTPSNNPQPHRNANNNAQASNNNVNRNSNPIVKRWEEKSGSSRTVHTLFKNGDENITTFYPCLICGQLGTCTVCHGSGQQYWRGLGTMQTCGMCHGSGKCKSCNGTKETSITTFRNSKTGEMSKNYYDNTGKLITPSSKGSKNNNSHNHKSSGKCSNCGGTGIEKYPMYEDDPSGASVNAVGQIGYTFNSSGICPYCGKDSWHVHLKCHKCRR